MTKTILPPESTPIIEVLEGVIAASIERLVEMRDRAPGFAILDEASQMEIITLLQAAEGKASLQIWDAQVDRMRQAEEDAENGDTESDDAPDLEDDFNCAPVRAEYERFLVLLACAGGRDRFRALEVRKRQGIEAAVVFLEGCDITPEADHGKAGKNASGNFHEASSEDAPAAQHGSPETNVAIDEIDAASALVQAMFCGTDPSNAITLEPQVPALCNMVHGHLNAAKRALGDYEPKRLPPDMTEPTHET